MKVPQFRERSTNECALTDGARSQETWGSHCLVLFVMVLGFQNAQTLENVFWYTFSVILDGASESSSTPWKVEVSMRCSDPSRVKVLSGVGFPKANWMPISPASQPWLHSLRQVG